MYLQQQDRTGPALVPVAACAAVMVLASVGALVVASVSSSSVLVQVLVLVGAAGLIGTRVTAPRARAWWSRPVPTARRRPTS